MDRRSTHLHLTGNDWKHPHQYILYYRTPVAIHTHMEPHKRSDTCLFSHSCALSTLSLHSNQIPANLLIARLKIAQTSIGVQFPRSITVSWPNERPNDWHSILSTQSRNVLPDNSNHFRGRGVWLKRALFKPNNQTFLCQPDQSCKHRSYVDVRWRFQQTMLNILVGRAQTDKPGHDMNAGGKSLLALEQFAQSWCRLSN